MNQRSPPCDEGFFFSFLGFFCFVFFFFYSFLSFFFPSAESEQHYYYYYLQRMATFPPKASAPPEDLQDPYTGYTPAPDYSAPALPPGWEMRYAPDGRPYYIDHNSRQTFWASPGASPVPEGPLYPSIMPAAAPPMQYQYQGPPAAYHAPAPMPYPPPVAPMVVSLQTPAPAPAPQPHRPAPTPPPPQPSHTSHKQHTHHLKKKTFSMLSPASCCACSKLIFGKVGFHCNCGSNFHLECGKRLHHR